jgi:hypothetical protein
MINPLIQLVNPLLEPAAEVRQQQHPDVREMAAYVLALEVENQRTNRKDTDARMEREQAIGRQMARDFEAIAKQLGVEIPPRYEWGGQNGWLVSVLSKQKDLRLLRHEWQGYKMATTWGDGRFKQLFRWGHDPEGAAADMASERARSIATAAKRYVKIKNTDAAIADAKRELLQDMLAVWEEDGPDALHTAIVEELENV